MRAARRGSGPSVTGTGSLKPLTHQRVALSDTFISPEGHGGGGHHQLDLEGLVLKLATKSALEKIHFVLNVNSHYWTQSPGAS